MSNMFNLYEGYTYSLIGIWLALVEAAFHCLALPPPYASHPPEFSVWSIASRFYARLRHQKNQDWLHNEFSRSWRLPGHELGDERLQHVQNGMLIDELTKSEIDKAYRQ